MAEASTSRYDRWVKRPIDFTVAVLGLVVLSPVLLILALWIRIALGSPVTFRQTRVGRNGRPFRLIKFRSMRDDRDASGRPLPDEERLTALGRRLRSWSLDELPELLNVLIGDMSLVGPRPLLHEYLPLYSARQARRHHVRPGLTGLAQVSGRNAVDWPARFELDVEYVERESFTLDCRILARTVVQVFSRQGITPEGAGSMPPFLGNDDSPGQAEGRSSN